MLSKRRMLLMAGVLYFLCFFAAAFTSPAEAAPVIPNVTVGVGASEDPQDVAVTMRIFVLLTVLTLAPSILIMTTSFIRVAVVLGFVRNVLSTQGVPPNQVVIALSLFLTFYIMQPYWARANTEGIQPYLAGQISQEEAYDRISVPLREFMFKQTREADIALFVNLSDAERPNTQEDVSTFALLPAFVISELKTAFQIGFMIYVPFIVVDMIIASTLMSMGMMMLPPTMISLPFKLLLFVMVDGWQLLIRSLIVSFN